MSIGCKGERMDTMSLASDYNCNTGSVGDVECIFDQYALSGESTACSEANVVPEFEVGLEILLDGDETNFVRPADSTCMCEDYTDQGKASL